MKKNVLTHKRFVGSVYFSAEDNVFHGKIEGINDLISFEGDNVTDLVKDFKESVEDYIELCKEVGKEPMKSYRGTLNIRIPVEVHKKAAQMASIQGISLNRFISKTVEKEVTA